MLSSAHPEPFGKLSAGSVEGSKHERRVRQLLRFDRAIRRRYGLLNEPIAGIDEVGRGTLAGPVLAGAVILRRASFTIAVDDSKRLSPEARERAYGAILPWADYGIGHATPEEIDRIGIGAATALAMRRAFERLPVRPALVLVDGPWVFRGCSVPAEAIVDGDAKSLSIACASIVAKVTRDRMMRTLHTLLPHYGFLRHKGYGTPEHLKQLRAIGPSSFHRFSFHPVHSSCHFDESRFQRDEEKSLA